MPLDDATLLTIEDSLIASALRPERWTETVTRIVDATGSRGAAALPLKGRVPGVPVSTSVEELASTYFSQGWAARDERGRGIPKLLQTGLFVDQDFATPDFMRSAPFYSDFLRPLGFQWCAGLLVDVGGDTWTLVLQRSPGQGPFTPDEQAALRRLLAPLNRTATLAAQLGEARLGGIADTLETMRAPSLLLDRFGRVLRVSSHAEAVMGPDLTVRLGEVVAPADGRANAALRAHIAAAIWSEVRPDDLALRPVAVARADRRPLLLRAQPLRKSGLDYFDGCRAILTITDLDARARLDRPALRQIYGLTPREAALCEALLQGASLNAIAETSGTSAHTVRSQMRAIFAKTRTGGQNELLILLNRHAQS